MKSTDMQIKFIILKSEMTTFGLHLTQSQVYKFANYPFWPVPASKFVTKIHFNSF